jgi:uncharacterized protein
MDDSTRMRLDRQDIILLLAAGADGPYALDPIRLMKGSFIVSQAGRQEWRDLYDFQPYDYGPFDTSVYRARDALLTKDLLAAEGGGRYPAYHLTDVGKQRVEELEQALDEKSSTWLRGVGHYVTSKSFTSLLDALYERFPEFTTRSVMRRA